MVVAADGTAYVGNFGFELGDRAAAAGGASARVAARRRRVGGGRGARVPERLRDHARRRHARSSARPSAARATAFTIAADGTLHDRRVWAELGDVMPDGCTLDAEGAIWFADAAGTAVVRVREGGEVADRVEAGQHTFACALGGDDGCTLFVVCADQRARRGRRGHRHRHHPHPPGRRPARRAAVARGQPR